MYAFPELLSGPPVVEAPPQKQYQQRTNQSTGPNRGGDDGGASGGNWPF